MSEEEDLDAEGMGRITALDLEDDWEAEAKRFSPAQRHTGTISHLLLAIVFYYG